jgi:tripartite-type tricarboxylate transporter receptor subunit TctC
MQHTYPVFLTFALISSVLPSPANAEWKPTRPVEFVVSAGAGGGTDQFARVIQVAIQKHQLMPVSIIVTNKPGGAGTEAFLSLKAAAGDAHKLAFSTNLIYLTPMITKVGYKMSDLRPVAAMAADEFLLWTYTDAPYKTAKDIVEAARSKGAGIKFGGGHSKDTDHILTRLIDRAVSTKVTYVPFKGGGEAAAQLAGGHIDANTNNPNENISHWKAGKVRPLCVFQSQRLSSYKEKITADMAFADIPTCKEEGIPIEQFSMPRTVWLPAKTTDEQVQYYVDVLANVRETPEWKEWLRTGLQTDFFITGSEFDAYIQADEKKHHDQFAADGWLVAE